MRIAVYKIKNVYRHTSYDSNSCQVISSITVFLDRKRIFKPVTKIINSFIEENTSEFFDKELYKKTDSPTILGFSAELTDELAQVIMRKFPKIEYIDGHEIVPPFESFHCYSESMGVDNDQESNYIAIKEKYSLDLENLKKEYHLDLINATIDTLNEPNPDLENNYPLDVAFIYEDFSLVRRLFERGATEFKLHHPILLFLAKENHYEYLAILYARRNYIFNDEIIGSIIYHTIIHRRLDFIGHFPRFKIDITKLYLYTANNENFEETISLNGETKYLKKGFNISPLACHPEEICWLNGTHFNAISLACLKNNSVAMRYLTSIAGKDKFDIYPDIKYTHMQNASFFKGNTYLYLCIKKKSESAALSMLQVLSKIDWDTEDIIIMIKNECEEMLKKILIDRPLSFSRKKDRMTDIVKFYYFLNKSKMYTLTRIFSETYVFYIKKATLFNQNPTKDIS